MTRPPAPPVRQIQTNRSDGGSQQPVRAASKGQLGRNDPCWCGSGKKYKQCHMRDDAGRAPASAPTGVGAPAGQPPAAQQAARNASAPKSQPAKHGKRR
jgi:hypothetical protein